MLESVRNTTFLDLEHGFARVRSLLQSPHKGFDIVSYAKHQTIYRQGDVHDAIYYIQDGSVMFDAVSQRGKTAVVSVRGAGEIFGQSVLIGRPDRAYTATTLSDCVLTRIQRFAAMKLMESNPDFTKFLLAASIAKHYDAREILVDHIVHGSQARLARLLLRLADVNDPGGEPAAVPKINQERLAEMVGTTRGRVNVFLNRFRQDGLIENETPIRVYRARMKAMLRKF